MCGVCVELVGQVRVLLCICFMLHYGIVVLGVRAGMSAFTRLFYTAL